MELLLSNTSLKPIYEQITAQIKAMIMQGELKPGDSLPSMRALAKSLHISVITAQHAYEDLQKEGFIETIPGKGTFVAATNQEFIREENLRIIEQHFHDVSEIAHTHGITLEELIQMLHLQYHEEESIWNQH